MTNKHNPGKFDEQLFQKGGLKGSLVVVIEAALGQGLTNLDGLKKRLCRVEAIVTASTLIIVAAAVRLFLR